jgi:hypothetical protein
MLMVDETAKVAEAHILPRRPRAVSISLHSLWEKFSSGVGNLLLTNWHGSAAE